MSIQRWKTKSFKTLVCNFRWLCPPFVKVFCTTYPEFKIFSIEELSWELRKKNSQKKILGNHAHFPQKMCPLCCSLSSLKHAQKISLTLLSMCSQHPPDVFTTCLAHYPMHYFIIWNWHFSPKSVFSPSPTLDPKAKIRSCLSQDQGSWSIPSKMSHLKWKWISLYYISALWK